MLRKTGLFVLPVLTLTLVGCQGMGAGPLTSRQTTLGTLKTSVSQLEFQNEQLQKQVADLKSENRRYEDRLSQEQAENDDLATRLDNVKGLLGQRGEPSDIRTGGRTRSDVDPDEPSTTRVKRSTSRRKPPAASIPGRLEPAKNTDDDLGSVESAPSRSRLASGSRIREDRWLPVAKGLGTRQTEIK